jgi:hypothetical protein
VATDDLERALAECPNPLEHFEELLGRIVPVPRTPIHELVRAEVRREGDHQRVLTGSAVDRQPAGPPPGVP